MTKKSKQTPALGREERRLRKVVISSIIEGGVARGLLDFSEKSESQIDEEIANYLSKLSDPETIIRVSGDHRPTLIARARAYRDSSEYELACLFFATWVEHWVNSVIRSLAARKQLDDKTTLSIIREVPIRGKLNWLLSLLGARPIAKAHRNKIMSLTEYRNAFVHYKWQSSDLDKPVEDSGLRTIVDDFEKTVSYLRRLENKYVLNDTRKLIRRYVGR